MLFKWQGCHIPKHNTSRRRKRKEYNCMQHVSGIICMPRHMQVRLVIRVFFCVCTVGSMGTQSSDWAIWKTSLGVFGDWDDAQESEMGAKGKGDPSVGVGCILLVDSVCCRNHGRSTEKGATRLHGEQKPAEIDTYIKSAGKRKKKKNIKRQHCTKMLMLHWDRGLDAADAEALRK